VTTELPLRGLVAEVVSFLPDAASMNIPSEPEGEQRMRSRRWRR
jgi:hypothetical protein